MLHSASYVSTAASPSRCPSISSTALISMLWILHATLRISLLHIKCQWQAAAMSTYNYFPAVHSTPPSSGPSPSSHTTRHSPRAVQTHKADQIWNKSQGGLLTRKQIFAPTQAGSRMGLAVAWLVPACSKTCRQLLLPSLAACLPACLLATLACKAARKTLKNFSCSDLDEAALLSRHLPPSATLCSCPRPFSHALPVRCLTSTSTAKST